MIGSLTTSDLNLSPIAVIAVVKRIWCVQLWDQEMWRTVYLCSFAGDAEVAYRDVLELSTLPVRLVAFRVDGADFVATYARDFAVCESRS